MKREFTGVSLLTHQPFLLNLELLQAPSVDQENPIRTTLKRWFCIAGGALIFSLTRLFGF